MTSVGKIDCKEFHKSKPGKVNMNHITLFETKFDASNPTPSQNNATSKMTYIVYWIWPLE